MCQDAPNFVFTILDDDAPDNANENDKRKSCSWIDDGTLEQVLHRRKTYCSNNPVINQPCQRACGECCGDSDVHTFEYLNSETNKVKSVDCEWLANVDSSKKKKKICSEREGACPVACDACPVDTQPPSYLQTIAPTPGPTPVPTPVQSMIPSLEPSKGENINVNLCQDVADFEFTNVAGNTRKCSWIDDGIIDTVSTRRRKHCRMAHVKAACPRACGECCGNNDDHTFEHRNTVTNKVKIVDCEWLADVADIWRKTKYCNQRNSACPVACDTCPTQAPSAPDFQILTPRPSTVPSTLHSSQPSVCMDMPDFEFTNVAGNTRKCSWIDDGIVDTVSTRRRKYCRRAYVKAACPRACGECCGDNDEHTFEFLNSEKNKVRTVGCDWLADAETGDINSWKKRTICNERNSACPMACGNCPTQAPITPLSQAPSTQPSKSCRDNPGFSFLKNGSSDKEVSCSWIDDAYDDVDVEFRREKHCSKDDVKENCKRACGECCGDNEIHNFQYLNSEANKFKVVDCEWLADRSDKLREKICTMKKLSCPEACDSCPMVEGMEGATVGGARQINSEATAMHVSRMVTILILGTTTLTLLSML